MLKNMLKALILLFAIFILPILIAGYCNNLDPRIRDYEDVSYNDATYMLPAEWGLKD